MKVKDLIEQLQECDPEAIVACPFPEYSFDVPVINVVERRVNLMTAVEGDFFVGFSEFPAINPLYKNEEANVVFLFGQE